MTQIEDLVGQKLMIGIRGTKLTPETVEIFRKTRAGGLIVFRSNFESAETFKKLISDLEETLQRKLLVAVDHEGGRVIHLAEGVTVFPDNWAVGNTQNVEYVKRQGEIEAHELRQLGIDLNLAPTLDVLTENFSPNIGIRSYGKDPKLVAQLGSARIQAMQQGGLSACAKHFPGQGHSPLDCHLDLPVLSASREEMENIHLLPFREAIRAGVDTLMTSHPIYPELDPENQPATFSRTIVHGLLRNELKFQGVILSDDLEMGALKGICSVGEAAKKAVRAGHDIVLLCHDPQAQMAAYQSLLEAYREKSLDLKELDESVERIERLKRKRSKRFAEPPSPLSSPPKRGRGQGEGVPKQIAREGMRITKNKSILPISKYSRVLVIFPELFSLNGRIFIEAEMSDENSFVRNLFEARGIRLDSLRIVDLDPDDTEIREALAEIKQSDLTIFFCYDAHLSGQTKKLLDKVESLARNKLVVLLRNPYDEQLIGEETCVLSTFGFRNVQIETAVEAMTSQCPVTV